ncbi:MAG: aminotransferase class III-fold pyridoxal phosphate-dependent enzyme [Cephaloticoccus sp.]|nr:aminotransferase class III-fold pyridoxal phosphate-dependent enzyme [Cephaloticoccus sp.]MCF7761195.1 aminotransferase class III-fold pyridoxal phosphate-dependent enzyme [Cephaloticoccus sp.]
MITHSSASGDRTQQLYRRGRELIPGGTQLLSKRPEMYAPELWPAYFQSAKGITLTDLDGRVFQDFSTMGIGACLLGYGCDAVDEAVITRIRNGSTSTLNAPEEVALAEKLVALHPWAQQARFTRAGGEAMAVAVRIARTVTDRSVVAVCGYHGWSDWYLAANLMGGDALGGHLLPGLEPAGVPAELTGTTFTFRYNQPAELEAICARHGKRLAAIVMEPMRHDPPRDGFLEKVRAMADRFGAVLIHDEITNGFRANFGGSHLRLGVDPDIAVFAKALGNGYPIGAVIGRAAVMDGAQQAFISSTSWTEGIGSTAGLATLLEMERLQPWSRITAVADRVMQGWRDLAQSHGLAFTVHGGGNLCALHFGPGEDANAIRTLFTQEMLESGYLAGAGFYPCAAHTLNHVEVYLGAVDRVFADIAAARATGNIRAKLKHREADQGFRRLT